MAMMVSVDTDFTEINLVLGKLIRGKRRFDAHFHVRASRRAAAKIALQRRSGLQSGSMRRRGNECLSALYSNRKLAFSQV